MAKNGTKTERPMPAKWHNIIASMVLDGMTFEDAGAVKSGEGEPLYSPGYMHTQAYIAIKQDVRFCKALLIKRKATESPRILSKHQRQEFWSNSMQDGEVDFSNRLRSSELLGKSCGDFLDVKVDLTPQSLADIAAITSGEAILELEGDE